MGAGSTDGETVIVEKQLTPEPMPVNVMCSGLPVVLSLTVSTAVRIPVAVGAKVMPMAQVLPGVMVPQVLELIKKSAAFAPVGIVLLITSGALPQLVMMRLCTGPVVLMK